MFGEIDTRTISKSQYDKFIDSLSDYELPTGHIGVAAMNGSTENEFRLTDGERNVHIKVTRSSSSVVNFSEPEEVEEANAIIYNPSEDKSWYISSDDISKFDTLPTLKQAFHEHEDYNKRDADYKYHFDDGETLIAVPSSNPVKRLDESIVISGLEFIGGDYPKQWLLESESGEFFYLRERAGTVKLYRGLTRMDELIFTAFVGREHPGTYLMKDEVINMVTSVDYISLADDYNTEVSEEAKDEYFREFKKSFDNKL